MRCLPVAPHDDTDLLVNPRPTRIQFGQMPGADDILVSAIVGNSSVSHMGVVVRHLCQDCR